MTSGLPGLEPGERLRAQAPASFRGAAAASSRATFAIASSRVRMRAYDAWAESARSSGFPAAGPDMVVGVTDARLVVWRTSFFLGRATELAGSIPLRRIADVAAVRHGLVTGLAFVSVDGAVIEVEAVRGRRLRVLAREVRHLLAEQHGSR